MNISEFSKVVSANPDKLMRFVLPSGKSIPLHYHITEVGHVKKDFMDCGGITRSVAACVLQAWIAVNDEDHRLEAGKLATILKMAAKILPDDDVPVELEYEAPIISQFSISGAEVGAEIVFTLTNKHTDCLAKESCGLDGGPCGAGEEDCCGSGNPMSWRKPNPVASPLGMTKPTILILCTGNSCRSHMAEGVLQRAAGDFMEVRSAGSKPAGYVHPLAIKVLAEIGIDISNHTSKHMNEFLNQPIATVITVCGNADQACPLFPRQLNRYHWGLMTPLTPREQMRKFWPYFVEVRDEIKRVFEPYAFGYRDALKARG